MKTILLVSLCAMMALVKAGHYKEEPVVYKPTHAPPPPPPPVCVFVGHVLGNGFYLHVCIKFCVYVCVCM